MSGFSATLVFMVVVLLYLLVIEIFFTLFRFTGLSKDKARFQSISLLTNAGYTTKESEDIANGPVRRKIAMFAMFFGYMFSVAMASSIINLVVKFMGENKGTNIINIVIILGFILFLYLIIRSNKIRIYLNNTIKKYVEIYISKKQNINPLYVMDTHGRFVVCEILIINVPQEIKDKTIFETDMRKKYDISLLTIKRDSDLKTIDAMTDIIKKDDRIIVFGNIENIKKLFQTDLL